MPFVSDKQRKFLSINKPEVAKKFSEHANAAKELAESSASSWALFKEEMPKKMRIEASDAEDTLMGRLASRMVSRDMIDELNLGPKGRSGKAKEAITADNSVPSKMMMGPGLHEQMRDFEASNFSNPIPNNAVAEGNNMAEQAKSLGNVYGKNYAAADNSEELEEEIEETSDLKHGDDKASKYNAKQLKMGIKVEYEHHDDPKVAEAIAKAHLAEIPDYYTRLAIMEKEGKAAYKK